VPEGVRFTDWVSIRDVAATIASLAALEPGLGGVSLERFWTEPPTPDSRMTPAPVPDTLIAQVSYASGHPPDYPVSLGDMQSILASPWQYIRRGDGEERLFDLTDSISARVDVAARAEMAPVLDRLRTYLDRALAGT
jgi:hypothetical protein